jgi:hypothetical protein
VVGVVALLARDGTDEPVAAYALERHAQPVRRKCHPSDGVRRRSGSKSQEPIPGEGPSCNPLRKEVLCFRRNISPEGHKYKISFMIIMSAPPVDKGILSILNSKLPGCNLNLEIAQWFTTTGAAKSVYIGTPCPSGYTAVPSQSYMASDATYQSCGKDSTTDKMPQTYVDGITACMNKTTPPDIVPSKTTPPDIVPSKTMSWVPWLILAVVLTLGTVGFYFMIKGRAQ